MENQSLMGCNNENEIILYPVEKRRGNYCSKLKKRELKTEKLSKVTI